MRNWSRRDFLEFLGYSAVFSGAAPALQSCSSLDPRYLRYNKIKSVTPTLKDDLILAEGFSYRKVISWNDRINVKEKFGFNNDFISYVPLKKDEILLWVNHEYTNPLFVSGIERTRKNIITDMKTVGGSIIHLKRTHGDWNFVKDSKYNKRLHALTSIPFSNGQSVQGKKRARGTLANCSGGKTPWGTILSAEENYDYFYGERIEETRKITKSLHCWETQFYSPPEHYGWIVEIDPFTGKATKRIELGRFCHESATVAQHRNGVVVYSGDDKSDEHLYKFISESNTNLEKGTLYVANLDEGRWIPLDIKKHKILQKNFKDQLDVLTYCRKASKLLRATPLARPEDIEVHPLTGDVYIALTGNKHKGDYYGRILRIRERNGDYHSTHFSADSFITGGPQFGFSNPDNVHFDKLGNFWFCSDISGPKMGKGKYQSFGNNGIFVVPFAGKNKGKVLQIASAPKDAEFTGLCFDPDEKRLFVSVQHPGELTKDKKKPTSLWPFDGSGIPKPSVVEIKSFLFESLI